MNLMGTLRRLGPRRADAPTLERKEMEGELATEVQAIRKCIAKVVEARDAHALVAGQRDIAVGELNELMAGRAAVQAQLTAREKEIALAGGEIPDEPFPEEADMARLNRHTRIRQERVRICESKLAARGKSEFF